MLKIRVKVCAIGHLVGCRQAKGRGGQRSKRRVFDCGMNAECLPVCGMFECGMNVPRKNVKSVHHCVGSMVAEQIKQRM